VDKLAHRKEDPEANSPFYHGNLVGSIFGCLFSQANEYKDRSYPIEEIEEDMPESKDKRLPERGFPY